MEVNNLTVSIGSQKLIENISFSLYTNNKIGLVGSNGSGKSTLLKTLSQIIKPINGNINYNGQSFGYLMQEINCDYIDMNILDYIKMETGILNLENQLRILENTLNDKNMDEYSEILNQYLTLDGYNFDDNLKIILQGLNFKQNINNTINILSGGEKIKIMLAVLLMSDNDILLLDEPTNNLDQEAVMWLEKFLINSNKPMIIISHDETFLDNVTN